MSETALRRTAAIELDQSFQVDATVEKAYVNETTGERFICGVATGIQEDRDGERVSAHAIRKMATTPTSGGAIPLMAATHVEDWAAEIGEVTKLEHDADHDELLVECKLPPAGADALADKAWHMLTVKKRKLGFSIGGKLKRAFYELGDRPGGVFKRKVLDEIALRHMTLTGRPAYPGTFAEAVAKTWDGEPPAEDEFVEVEIAKAEKDEPETDAPDTAAPGKDEPAKKADDEETDEISDAEAAKDLPEGKGARHMACPSCGHEFAAPLSSDLAENRSDSKTNASDANEDTGKMATTTDKTNDLDAALARVREIADAAPVEKTEDKPAEVAVVEKTETELVEGTDVEKQIAAVHRHADERAKQLEADVAKGFSQLVDVVKSLAETVAGLPQGRKSVARVEPGAATRAEVAKTATETDTVAKRMEDAEDALGALRELNAGKTSVA